MRSRNVVPTFAWLFLWVLLLALGLFVVGLDRLLASGVDPTRVDPIKAELGKWLLTAASTLFAAGAIGALLKFLDQRRTDRSSWETELVELARADQRLWAASTTMRMFRDTATWWEQMREVMAVRGVLHVVLVRSLVYRDTSVQRAVQQMYEYVDHVCDEYEDATVRPRQLPDTVQTATLDDFVNGTFTRYQEAYELAQKWMRYRARLRHKKPTKTDSRVLEPSDAGSS